jgi:hypothetical protein
MWDYVEHNDSWPRLSPKIRGIVLDFEYFVHESRVYNLTEFREEAEIQLRKKIKTMASHFITVIGEFSLQLGPNDIYWAN